jgi:hypothetical protein
MAERYEFKTKFEKERENQKKEAEFSLWEKPLVEDEIMEFFHEIKRIRDEKKSEEKIKEIKKLLPHLLGKRCEEKLREQGKKLVEIECEGGEEILKPRGYEWFSEENEEKQGLKIRRAVIEKEEGEMKKMRTDSIIFSGEKIEEMTDKFLTEIKHLKKEDLWKIEEKKRKKREQAKRPKVFHHPEN